MWSRFTLFLGQLPMWAFIIPALCSATFYMPELLVLYLRASTLPVLDFPRQPGASQSAG